MAVHSLAVIVILMRCEHGLLDSLYSILKRQQYATGKLGHPMMFCKPGLVDVTHKTHFVTEHFETEALVVSFYFNHLYSFDKVCFEKQKGSAFLDILSY